MWHVLIVDDEPAILDGLAGILPWEEYGMELTARATSAREALSILQEGNIDLLVTDIQMPQMDGLALIRAANALPVPPRVIILSAHDAFDYVREAIRLGVENYLLKPINRQELSETLRKTMENLKTRQVEQAGRMEPELFRENVLHRWLTNAIEPNELRERAELAGIDLAAAGYLPVAIKCLGEACTARGTAGAKRMAGLIAESLLPTFSGNSFRIASGTLILLLRGAFTNTSVRQVQTQLESVMPRLRHFSGHAHFIVMGKPVRVAEEVPGAYEEMIPLLSMSFLKPEDTVLPVPWGSAISIPQERGAEEERQTNSPALWQNPPDTARQLVDATPDEHPGLVDALLSPLPEISARNLPEVKFHVTELVSHLLRATKRHPFLSEKSAEALETTLATFESLDSLEQLRTWILDVCGRVSARTATVPEVSSPLVKAVLSHMGEHFHEDLSLRQLSQRHNVNASYLGQLFRTETGALFSDHLNQLRLEHAEQLLRTTDAKVADIARMAGYNNVSHFNHTFKIRYGVTPNRYRQA